MPSYDVFLSYNEKERDPVEMIAGKLQQEGIQPWLDIWSLVPGRAWQPELESALAKCTSCAVFVGKDGIGPWQDEEMRVAIQQRVKGAAGFRVIPVILPTASVNALHLPAFLTATTWVRFENGLDDPDAFHRLLSGIRGVEPGPRLQKSKAKTQKRIEIQITVIGAPEDFQRTAKAAEQMLRDLSGDERLTIKFIRQGSIKLLIDCSEEGFERLKMLVTEGRLTSLAGFQIAEISLAKSDEERFQGQRIYEALFIMRADTSDEDIKEFIDRLRDVISGSGGAIHKIHEWGIRKLAYRIEKQSEGSYVLLQFQAPPETVHEVERHLRITGLVLKFLTVRIDQTLAKLAKRKQKRDARAQASAKRSIGRPGIEHPGTGIAADAPRYNAESGERDKTDAFDYIVSGEIRSLLYGPPSKPN
jgi:ribosomal protein S6